MSPPYPAPRVSSSPKVAFASSERGAMTPLPGRPCPGATTPKRNRSVLSNIQLLEQLALQHKMNATVNPDWVRAKYNWTRAVMVEAVEALDHLGWKWWKAKPVADESQFRLELVDIWHFILSNELVHTEGDPHEAAANLRAASRQPTYAITASAGTVDLRELAARDLLHVLIGAA